MNQKNQNISLARLLQSLEPDFDPDERAYILDVIKNTSPTDEALQGAKMLLEANNWDYTKLQQAFQKTENRIENSLSTPKKEKKSYLKYAAILIPFVILIGYKFYSSVQNQKTIDSFYPKEVGLPNYMGSVKINWEEIMLLYQNNKIKEAYVVSKKTLNQHPQNDTIIYFHGVISYELKKYEEAKVNYSKMLHNKTSVFYYDAYYRLGFTLKKLKMDKEANQLFNSIAKDQNNPYSENSKKLIAFIKKDL